MFPKGTSDDGFVVRHDERGDVMGESRFATLRPGMGAAANDEGFPSGGKRRNGWRFSRHTRFKQGDKEINRPDGQDVIVDSRGVVAHICFREDFGHGDSGGVFSQQAPSPPQSAAGASGRWRTWFRSEADRPQSISPPGSRAGATDWPGGAGCAAVRWLRLLRGLRPPPAAQHGIAFHENPSRPGGDDAARDCRRARRGFHGGQQAAVRIDAHDFRIRAPVEYGL